MEKVIIKGEVIGYKLFEVIVGSYLYGLDTPKSDIDKKVIFIPTMYRFLTGNYQDNIIDKENETTYWELRKFIKHLSDNQANALEIVFAPKESIFYVHPSFEVFLNNPQQFLTTKILDTFVKAAQSQIKKASGTNKKMNWREEDKKRLTPMDFCYVIIDSERDGLKLKQGVLPLRTFMQIHALNQNSLLCTKLEHSKEAHQLFISDNITKGLEVEDSNHIRVSETPKGLQPIGTMFYNIDGYSQHCRKFNEYTAWLENMNLERFKANNNHNQMIDGKNMAHCHRFLQSAIEILRCGDWHLKANEEYKKYYLSIKNGEMDLKTLFPIFDSMELEAKSLVETCGLKDEIDPIVLNYIEYSIRKQFLL